MLFAKSRNIESILVLAVSSKECGENVEKERYGKKKSRNFHGAAGFEPGYTRSEGEC